ncbi:HD-GYP domain-containing protein [Dechloromonas sp.]|uniref:HD-GYP domain-containing protein n=1 Tax=Dechloromonas sp. TaxID=1917218 RepID=UPI001206C687|nr:HD-GYP domain-containing protein [Dechloromonas sp.]MBU3697701.1 HD-GYP domain-containing protein [Dechloromonas sp.]TEX44773.1 MAG: phosphodiesterase [Rhodocyclaceae bacterium]
MIRKIPLAELLPEMFVVDLHKPWIEHAIWRFRFRVRDEAHIRKLREAGIVEVSIDTDQGIDLPPLPTSRLHDVEQRIYRLAERPRPPAPRKVSLGEERRRAGRLLADANDSLTELMFAARAGRQVEAGRLEPVVGKMIESVLRNPDALVPLARLKQLDAYATEHAVATTALIIALGHQQRLTASELEKLAMGTLLKDVGHASLDARLTSKAGMLSRDEYSLVQSHVEEGLAVLEATARLPEMSVAVVLEHHERYNGCGYPYRMAGDEISLAGRMAAIVDTYDAMTSDRPYRAALSPAQALRQLYDQGGSQFDPALVAAFVRTVGVYPVGTLVMLESGHLAVVEELHPEQLLQPVVRVIYHARRRQYVTPMRVDLARKVGNHYGLIQHAETYERWGLSPQRWQPA